MRRALTVSLLIHAAALAWLPWSSAAKREPPAVRFASASLERPSGIEPRVPDPAEPPPQAQPRESFELPPLTPDDAEPLPNLDPRPQLPAQIRAPVHYRIRREQTAPARVAPAVVQPPARAAPLFTPPRAVADKHEPPRYPSIARRRAWQGTTILELRIGAQGRVESVAVRKSSGYAVLDREALRVAREWRYQPGIRNGRPVAATLLQPVAFRLR